MLGDITSCKQVCTVRTLYQKNVEDNLEKRKTKMSKENLENSAVAYVTLL